jgi:hypothetical protein
MIAKPIGRRQREFEHAKKRGLLEVISTRDFLYVINTSRRL